MRIRIQPEPLDQRANRHRLTARSDSVHFDGPGPLTFARVIDDEVVVAEVLPYDVAGVNVRARCSSDSRLALCARLAQRLRLRLLDKL